MSAPHILGVPCAGAERNQICADSLAVRGDDLQPTKAFGALLRVGMNHVEIARNRRHANAAFAHGVADPFGQRGIDAFGEALQSRASKVELNAIELMGDHCVERLLKCGPNECFCENAELHQTPPFTSSSRTRSPLSTERAMATSARIAAAPSSTVAPCCGLACRIVSANAS